jgi:polyhydroxyalkanoate synthesis repressor PhaR
MSDESTTRRCVHLRKYPNRRYYDASRSCHVTLEEIHELIRDGSDVHIKDSKTGEDITTKVLAQIILEQDPPKLAIFPVDLLHQVIRANDSIVRDFVDKYFNQALRAFLDSQRQFDRYLREAMGLHSPAASGSDWARVMMGPLAQMFFTSNGDKNGADQAAAGDKPANSAEVDLRQLVQELREQVKALQEELRHQRQADI